MSKLQAISASGKMGGVNGMNNMAGTSEGARKTRDKLLARDPNYYSERGKKGGSKSKETPFSKDRNFAREMSKRAVAARWGRKHV